MMLLCVFCIFAVLAVNVKQISNEDLDNCIAANQALQKCKKNYGNACKRAGKCQSVKTFVSPPANLSQTDQALWESSHKQ